LTGIVLSLAIHGAAFYSKGLYSPPAPRHETGQTVVHLTLMPSLASQAAEPESAPSPEPQPEEPVTQPDELPTQQAILPQPSPEPSVEPQSKSIPEETAVNSPEQDASLAEEKGVSAIAQTSKAIQPIYPRISRRRGESGTVTLAIEVLANGRAGQISMIQSSGYRRLDEAAVEAAEQTGFIPAKQFGRAVDSSLELSFTFELTDD
jgi:protein TonB